MTPSPGSMGSTQRWSPRRLANPTSPARSSISRLGSQTSRRPKPRYRALLERAQKVEDILAVQSRLDQVRGEIEQLKAQHKDISGQADLATLTVTLTPVAAPVQKQAETWDLGAQLSEAVATLVGIGQAVASALIVFVIVWLPVLLVLGIIALVLLRGVLEARRRLPIVAPVGASPGRLTDQSCRSPLARRHASGRTSAATAILAASQGRKTSAPPCSASLHASPPTIASTGTPIR